MPLPGYVMPGAKRGAARGVVSYLKSQYEKVETLHRVIARSAATMQSRSLRLEKQIASSRPSSQ